jgi:hypothetical protein
MHAELTRRLSQLDELELQNMVHAVRALQELFGEPPPVASRRSQTASGANRQGARS